MAVMDREVWDIAKGFAWGAIEVDALKGLPRRERNVVLEQPDTLRRNVPEQQDTPKCRPGAAG